MRKSKSLRKVFVKTPGGKTVIHYKQKVGTAPKCPTTGQQLHGIKRTRPAQQSRLAKSKKTIARKFGGLLSSWASRREIIKRTRS